MSSWNLTFRKWRFYDNRRLSFLLLLSIKIIFFQYCTYHMHGWFIDIGKLRFLRLFLCWFSHVPNIFIVILFSFTIDSFWALNLQKFLHLQSRQIKFLKKHFWMFIEQVSCLSFASFDFMWLRMEISFY